MSRRFPIFYDFFLFLTEEESHGSLSKYIGIYIHIYIYIAISYLNSTSIHQEMRGS